MQDLLNLLGLAQRAGCLKTGIPAVETALQKGIARLVFLDEGASDNSRKAVTDACAYRAVRLSLLTSGTLGHAIGKPGHMAVAVTSPGFAARMVTMLDHQQQNG